MQQDSEASRSDAVICTATVSEPKLLSLLAKTFVRSDNCSTMPSVVTVWSAVHSASNQLVRVRQLIIISSQFGRVVVFTLVVCLLADIVTLFIGGFREI